MIALGQELCGVECPVTTEYELLIRHLAFPTSWMKGDLHGF